MRVFSLRVNQFVRSEFLKNVALLMSGNILAQALSLGATPIVTRLYTPEVFGLFALFMAITNIIGSISTLCYERAIVLPKENTDALSTFWLSILILFVICSISAVSLFALKDSVGQMLGNMELANWILLVPIAIFTQSLVRILSYWHFRLKQFQLVAISRVCESLVNSGIKIIVGFVFGAWVGGLIIGFLLSSMTAFFILRKKPKGSIVENHSQAFSLFEIKNAMIEYRNFPLYGTWNVLITRGLDSLVLFMLSYFFSTTVVGCYSLANRVLSQPISLLSNSFSNVFLQQASYNVTTNADILLPFKKMIGGLFVIGIIPFLLIGIFGKNFFIFVFGAKWVTAGIYVQIMAPWLFFVFLSGPAHVIFEVLKKQNIKLVYNCFKGISSVTTLVVVSIATMNPQKVLIGFVCVNIFFEIIYLFISYRLAVYSHTKLVNNKIN